MNVILRFRDDPEDILLLTDKDLLFASDFGQRFTTLNLITPRFRRLQFLRHHFDIYASFNLYK